jgi:Herpesviridae UL52/UL70 DNA primase
MDWTDHAEALAATLVVPMNFMKSSFPILGESKDAMALKDGDVGTLSSGTIRGKGPIGKMRNSTNQTGKSPFPFLDDFVIHTLCCRGGIQGEIRCWTMDVNQNLPISITYQIQKNRWCEAIGRPHKSNGIMWIIDFERMEFRQSCFDIECRTQRSKCQSKPLSMSLQQQLSDSLFEMELMLRTEEAEGKLILENYDDSDLQESITILEKKSPTTQNEFDDDDEFEKALVALTLDDSPSAVTSAEILT